MAQELYILSFQASLFKIVGKNKQAFSPDEDGEVYEKLNVIHGKFEEHLKKRLGIKSVCISCGVIECHVESDWELDRIKNLCGTGEPTRVIKEFIEKEVISLLNFAHPVIMDFKWNTIQNSGVSHMISWFENNDSSVSPAGQHTKASPMVLYSDMLKSASRSEGTTYSSHADECRAQQQVEGSASSHKNSGLSIDQASGHEKGNALADDGNFESQFLLFTPISAGMVEKAWLAIIHKNCDGVVLMKQHENIPDLWTTTAVVERGGEYCYRVKSSVTSSKGFFSWGKKETVSQIQEKSNRQIIEHRIQKDMFGPPTERKEIEVGYTVFLPLMLCDMETEDDLWFAIQDFEAKHAKIIACCDHYDMAVFMLDTFCKTVRQRSMKAMFAVYFLSKMFPASNSIVYNKPRIDEDKVASLLKCLKACKSKQMKTWLDEKMADMLVSLVKKAEGGSRATWLHFIGFCGHVLSSECLLNCKHNFYNNQVSQNEWKIATQTLLNCDDEYEERGHLLMEVLKRWRSLPLCLDILKTVKLKLSPDSNLLTCIRNYVAALAKDNLKGSGVYINDINTVLREITSADNHLLPLLRKEFEEAILSQLNKKSLDLNLVLDIVVRNDLFCDREQAFKVMQMTAKSDSEQLHSLFPRIAEQNKFLEVLNDDTNQFILLVDIWLNSAKKIKPAFGYDRKWYDHSYQVLQVAAKLQDDQIRCRTEELIDEYFSSSAKKSLSQLRTVSDITVLAGFLKTSGNVEKKVLCAICPDLEKAVLKLIDTTSGWSKKEHVTSLLLLLHSPLLFNEPEIAAKMLQSLATCKAPEVHGLFLQAMCDRFLQALQLKELCTIFQNWISTAKCIHCRDRARSSSFSTEIGTVMFLYEYLADFMNLDILSNYQDLKHDIEVTVKVEFGQLDTNARMELIDSAVNQRKDVTSLLENHYADIKSGTLSDKEIKVWFKRYADAGDIDLKLRAKFMNFKVFLKNLHDRMQSFTSDVDKDEFVLTYSAFWLKLLSYKGVHEEELKSHDAMLEMTCAVTRFAESTWKSEISLKDFKRFDGIIKDVAVLIERLDQQPVSVNEGNEFLIHWEKLKHAYDESQHRFALLSALYASFLRRMKCSMADLKEFKKVLKRIGEKLDDDSCCPMGDMNKPGFFSSAYDLLQPAEELYPLKDFKTFINLCQQWTQAAFAKKFDFDKSTELNLSSMFSEESVSLVEPEVLVFDVADNLQKECIGKFRDWVKEVTNEETYLTTATQFGEKHLHKEVKDASKHFAISVNDSILSALEWLSCLSDYSNKAKNVQKTLQVLEKSFPNLDEATDTFFDCLDRPEEVTIEQLANVMNELKDLFSEKDNDWWDLIKQLSKATELVHFIRQTLDDDFRNLIDAVEEQSEQTIDESTVSDLIQVKQFLQPLLRQTFLEPQEFFDSTKKSMQKEGKDIAGKINHCSANLHGLMALYQHVANRGELTKEIINNAMTVGKYVWNLEKGASNCSAALTYTKHKTDFKYGSEELNDFRSRALLLSNTEKREKDQKTKQVKDVLRNFVNAVDKIQEICSTVSELHQLGHFLYRTYSCKLKSGNMFLESLSSRLNDLKQDLENWKFILESSRQKYNSLNCLYADQLSLMCNFLLRHLDPLAMQQIEYVLKFVHPGSTIEELRQHQQTGFSKDSSDIEKLALIGNAMDKVVQSTKVVRVCFPKNETFLKQSTDVNAVVESRTLFIVHLDVKSTNTIPTLLSLYANTKRHFPVPSEVLFCHELTSWEEIQLLINRSIQTQPGTSELHCICNVERLSSNLQTQLVEELSHLLEIVGIKYHLAVICRGGEHHSITDYFSSYVHRLAGFDTATLKTCLQTTWPNVSMVTSGVPGLGKTEYIKNLASEKGKRMKTVHISGPISRETLVTQLQSQKLTSCDLLHLDIGEVDDPNFLDASLFEYIVLGCLCSGTKVVCLSTAFVAIEVANTVQDRLRDSLVVLSSFNRKHLSWTDYELFVVSNEICSPIQIVCNYLKSYDEGALDSTDIVLNGSKSIKPLPPAECKELLRKHFCSGADLSYSVTEIFVNVFGDQLRKLSNSQFFRVSNLKAMLGSSQPIDVRSRLMKALLDVAKEFACRSVQACRSIQNVALLGVDAVQGNEKSHSAVQKLTQAELMVKRVNGMLQWADTNHLLVTFNGIDSQTVSALYRELSLVPSYIKELFKSQLRRELPDLNNLSQQELQLILERVGRSKSQKDKSKNLDTTYALTPDNILKMILILLRVRANIPVVIMGETGCGKTSLIRYLAQMCDTEFKHFSIHAGITVNAIKNTVLNCHDQCVKSPNTTVWLFLDEINTCDHLGLLTEIICHHSCFGKTLSKNLIFIAACNPYRLREEHQIMTAGLEGKVKTDSFSKLVYRVHPLPETMIDYIWDYGTLHEDDEKSYIKQMVSKVFPEAKLEWNLKEKIVELLVASQNFIRKSEESDWCVSLRDVYRCQMLMTQFLKMLLEKSEHLLNLDDPPVYYDKTDETIYNCSIALALAHCYQSRLATTQKRDEYWKLCAQNLFGTSNRWKELTAMVRYEQLDLLNRMDLPQGIAKNTALCENVFVILVCILNRIPVFLVGKPGCSKSLSVQLIKSNLRGKDSANSYFQTLPNLYVVSYQGSESSTSEGIEKVFRKAEKYGDANTLHNVLPVVLLDEVGLAEASRFNPLKVLHGLLEPDTGELPKVAVVGISNWSLDAAKMNRAIHLSRPDMDVRELFETGKSISATPLIVTAHKLMKSSVDLTSQVNEETLRALAEAYYRYQQEQLVKNFHGLRDYYSLIKYVSRLLNDQESNSDGDDMDEIQVIQRGLLRNFGGTEYGVSGILKLFNLSLGANTCPKWPIQEFIMDNLKDKLARHLMLITRGDSSLGILLDCLSMLDRKYVIIFGSKFEEDQTEDYSYRILSRIILCMETGSVLILKDLDTIYGSLYDMLNQNYTVVGMKKNCRIALGPYSNPMCQVHDDFRCIVLVDEHKVNYSDPPFLNRFEKQILRFDDIISAEQKKEIRELQDWVDDFCKMPHLSFVKENAFIGVNADTISSVVYQVTQSASDDKDSFKECQDTLLWLVPPDAMLRVTHSEFANKSTQQMKNMQSKYFERPVHEGLSKFLSVVLKEQHEFLPPVFNKTSGLRMVVYTHSNIYVDLHKALKQHEPVQVEKLGSFRSEKQLTNQIRQFFESNNRFLILQCEPREDGEHIPLAKFQLEELHQEYAQKSEKHICIVLHVERCTSSDTSNVGQFSFLSGWQMAVVDSLEQQESFPLTRALSMNSSDILQTEFCPIEQCIQKNLVWAFTCTSSSFGERSIQEFSELITQISGSEQMLSCLAECILEHIKGSENKVDSLDLFDPGRWQVKVACDLRLLQSATSFTEALKLYLMLCVTTPLANLIYDLEKQSAWHSYFRNEETAANTWRNMFQNHQIFSLSAVEIPQGPGSFKISHKPLNLQCPFSQVFIEKLCMREELFKQDLLEAEMTSSGGNAVGVIAYLTLFDKYKCLFEDDISLLQEFEILQSFEQEIIHDLCNCLSLGYVLDEEDRIQVALWLIEIKSHPHPDVTPEVHLTESLLCLWRYEPLLHALLQLISECRSILPGSVKEMLSEIGSKKQLKEEMQEAGFHLQNDSNEVSDLWSKGCFVGTKLTSFDDVFKDQDEETEQKPSTTEVRIENSDEDDASKHKHGAELLKYDAHDSFQTIHMELNTELEESSFPEYLGTDSKEKMQSDDIENQQLTFSEESNITEVGETAVESQEYGKSDFTGEWKNDEQEGNKPNENKSNNEKHESMENFYRHDSKSESDEVEDGDQATDAQKREIESISDDQETYGVDDHSKENKVGELEGHLNSPQKEEYGEEFENKTDEEINPNTGTDDSSDLQPEEQLIHLLCKLLIPRRKVLEECHGVTGWRGRVCSVLSFGSSVSDYPVIFHVLRIFNDLATVLFHCELDGNKISQFLIQLSEVVDVEDLDNSLNSLFDRVFELHDMLDYQGVPEIEFQSFVCMYIGRNIDINPETELFDQFLLKAARLELPDKNLSHLEVLLHRVFLEVGELLQVKSLFDLLKSIILDEGEDLASISQLQAMDAALQEVDLKKPLFLILCVDVIQETVMKGYAWENLEDVKSAANDLLFTFKTSVELIASSETSSLRVAAAVAFVKEFLHHMMEIIVYDFGRQNCSGHTVLYQNVNALLNSNELSSFLLRQIKLNRSFEVVKNLAKTMENVMPVLLSISLPEDDLALTLGYKVLGRSSGRSASLETALKHLNSDDKLVRDYLTKSKDEKELLCLTESLLHSVYLPTAVRPLTDTEKQVGEWFKENAALLPYQLVQGLYRRIANVESFGAALFRITPEMTFAQLQQTAFLLHLISVLVVKKSLNQGNLLTECLIRADTVFKVKLHSQLEKKHSNGSWLCATDCSLVTCKCWSRVIFSGPCEECPVCGCEWVTVGVHLEQFVADNLLPVADACFGRQSLAVEILRLLIDGSLLCSLALGILDKEAVKAVCEISDLDFCESFLQTGFQKSWNVLEESLHLSAEELSLFLHSIVDQIDLFVGIFDFHNTEKLKQQLEHIQTNIVDQFLRPSLYIDLKLYQRNISVTSPEVQQNILELPIEDCEELPHWLTSVLRVVGKRTMADMKVQYYISQKENDHPVIDLFFKKGQHLILLKHLKPVMKWSQVCYQATNHRFSREDGKTLTLTKLIHALPEMKESLKKSFDKFTESWEDLCKEENFSVLRAFDSSLPTQPQTDRVLICENSDSLIYKVLKALVSIQNMFLTELLAIAQSGKCPSLGFLKKNFTNKAVIKSVLLQNIKENEVIVCDFESAEAELIKFAQNNLLYGLGGQVCYNFVKIEMELANMLSLGKAYVIINQSFPFVTYANEMFVACASVLREFKLIISQKPLGQSVKDGLKEKMKNNRDFVNQMMRQTEILLCLAKKTGGSPDQTLKNYNQSWLKTLPGGFSEENLVFEGEPLCLSHLVALYEFLENLQADAAIKSMMPEFRRPLPKAVEKELKDFANTNHIELSSIQVAFRRFIMRHLVNFDPEKMDLDGPLLQWMAEPSLWPEGVKENGELSINEEGGTPKIIRTAFPQMLNLEHTFCALTYIDEMIEERTNQHAKWLSVERKPVTGSATSGAAKTQQGRQRTRTRLGKT